MVPEPAVFSDEHGAAGGDAGEGDDELGREAGVGVPELAEGCGGEDGPEGPRFELDLED